MVNLRNGAWARAGIIAIVGLALVFAANPGAIRAGSGGGGSSLCPATVGKDTALRSDCIGSIQVTASGVTLDCAGHAVNQTSFDAGVGDGITLGAGIHDVVVKNCVVNGFYRDFYLTSAHSNTLAGNTANGPSYSNSFYGFVLEASASNTLASNTANAAPFGVSYDFVLDGSASNTLRGNTANGGPLYTSSSHGFILSGSEANTLSRNTASGTSTGFALGGSQSNTLSVNTATRNDIGIVLGGSAMTSASSWAGARRTLSRTTM